MFLAYFIDPERITDRLFGGPHFTAGYFDGSHYWSADRSKRWNPAEVNRCWFEGRNCEPEIMEAA